MGEEWGDRTGESNGENGRITVIEQLKKEVSSVITCYNDKIAVILSVIKNKYKENYSKLILCFNIVLGGP